MTLASHNRLRLDRWLCFARLTKSRTRAAVLVCGGAVRVNRVRVRDPSHGIKIGDVLTIAVSGLVKVWRVERLGARRGPPEEARKLYSVISAFNDSAAASPSDLTTSASLEKADKVKTHNPQPPLCASEG